MLEPIVTETTNVNKQNNILINGLTEEEFEKLMRQAEEEQRAKENVEAIQMLNNLATSEDNNIYLSSGLIASDYFTHAILYSENSGYTEYLDGTPKTVRFIFDNFTSHSVRYTPIIVEYNGFGQMLRCITAIEQTVNPNSLLVSEIPDYSFSDDCSYVKFLMLNMNTLQPYSYAQAFYEGGDMYSSNQRHLSYIDDISKPIRGIANNNDIDGLFLYIPQSGNYKIECTCTGEEPKMTMLDLEVGFVKLNASKEFKVNIQAGYYYLYLMYGSGHYTVTITNIDTNNSIPVVSPKIRNDSSFIYVNHPEYITYYDIVDQAPFEKTKIFEQKNVTGKNTFYETHIAWWGNGNYPTKDFYIDVDFYNPSNEAITINISDLAYGTLLENSVFYIVPNNLDFTITVGAGEHYLLLGHSPETFYQSLLCPEPSKNENGAYTNFTKLAILFDFEVMDSKTVTVSSLAASDELFLILEGENRVGPPGSEIKPGDIDTNFKNRENEHDIHHKAKGIAENQGAWIDTELTFEFTDSTPNGTLPVYYQDKEYPAGVKGPGDVWMSHISPTFDVYSAFKYSMPNNLHKFVYTNSDGKEFHFDIFHKDLLNLDSSGANAKIDDNVLEDLKRSVETGIKAESLPQEGSVNPFLSLGEWGTAYKYKVTFRNNGTSARRATVKITGFDEMLIGYRFDESSEYTTGYYRNKWATNGTWVSDITSIIPPGEEVIFDIITLCCIGKVGTTYKAELSNT
ncbi:MAG: hypothetical protein J6A69_02720 [Clostridia bacterium]|nr:hypothetical protein [Clostridia bacterium]